MLNSILSLIVDTAASVLGGVLLLRFWMQAIRVRPPNALAHFMYQLTDWLVKPLRRLLPGLGGYDWASLAGAFVVVLAAVAIDLALGHALVGRVLIVLSLLRMLDWILYGFMGLILIAAVLSWVNPDAPMAPFVRALSDPLMRPLRRIIPPIGNIDLSPMVALLLLQIALRVSAAIVVQTF